MGWHTTLTVDFCYLVIVVHTLEASIAFFIDLPISYLHMSDE